MFTNFCENYSQLCEYYVKWEGYDDHYNEWIPLENFTTDKTMVYAYHAELNKNRQSDITMPTKQPARVKPMVSKSFISLKYSEFTFFAGILFHSQ